MPRQMTSATASHSLRSAVFWVREMSMDVTYAVTVVVIMSTMSQAFQLM